jgi:hypothetical protein
MACLRHMTFRTLRSTYPFFLAWSLAQVILWAGYAQGPAGVVLGNLAPALLLVFNDHALWRAPMRRTGILFSAVLVGVFVCAVVVSVLVRGGTPGTVEIFWAQHRPQIAVGVGALYLMVGLYAFLRLRKVAQPG